MGGVRQCHPPGAVERPRHAQLIGKNEPHPAVAEAGTGAVLRAGPAQGCNVAVRVDLHRVDGGRPREALFRHLHRQSDRIANPLRLWLCLKRAAGKATWAEALRLLMQAGRCSGLATVATATPRWDSIEAPRGR